jgi:hypothetical protein
VQFAATYGWSPEVVDRIPGWLFDEWWHLKAFLEEVADERRGRQPPPNGPPG